MIQFRHCVRCFWCLWEQMQVGNHFEGKNMIITSACGHLLEFKDCFAGKVHHSNCSSLWHELSTSLQGSSLEPFTSSFSAIWTAGLRLFHSETQSFCDFMQLLFCPAVCASGCCTISMVDVRLAKEKRRWWKRKVLRCLSWGLQTCSCYIGAWKWHWIMSADMKRNLSIRQMRSEPSFWTILDKTFHLLKLQVF